MFPIFIVTALVCLALPISAHPGVVKRDNPCPACYSSTWTHGADCTTDAFYTSIVHDIENPPATVTSYTPTAFCSAFLQQTDLHVVTVTYSATTTISSHTYIEHLVTITDFNHPTSTIYCPSPSPNAVCGIKFHGTIAPQVMGEEDPGNRDQFIGPVDCHKMCMERPQCHSFLVDVQGDTPFCDLFDQNLGPNGTRADPNPEKVDSGPAWYDRNCPQYLPAECQQSNVAKRDSSPELLQRPPSPAQPYQPLITPPPRDLRARGIERRDTSYPDYLSSNYAWAGGYFLTYGCSCIITSALPVTPVTTTTSSPVWIGTTTTTSTFNDYFTVTVTPHSTTVYSTIM